MFIIGIAIGFTALMSLTNFLMLLYLAVCLNDIAYERSSRKTGKPQ